MNNIIRLENEIDYGKTDWWCPTCKTIVPGEQVTYYEYHETCGTYLGDCQTDHLLTELTVQRTNENNARKKYNLSPDATFTDLAKFLRQAEAERDSLRNMLDACEENNAALRAELTTCNQALEAAQARVRALEKVAEAAQECVDMVLLNMYYNDELSEPTKKLVKAVAVMESKRGVANARD